MSQGIKQLLFADLTKEQSEVAARLASEAFKLEFTCEQLFDKFAIYLPEKITATERDRASYYISGVLAGMSANTQLWVNSFKIAERMHQ